jgi:dipeptide/tripeptide permease
LPTISLSFQISAGTGSWLAIAYFLVLSSVLLLVGMFLIASFGVSTTLTFIIASLALMGIGGGGFSSPNI